MTAQAHKTDFGAVLVRADGSRVALDHDEVNALRAAFGAPPTSAHLINEHLARHRFLTHAQDCAVSLSSVMAPGVVCTCGASRFGS